MSAVYHFGRVRMRHKDIAAGRAQMREMLSMPRLNTGQCLKAVGFAAESAFIHAVDPDQARAFAAPVLDYDVILQSPGFPPSGKQPLKLELKTRVASTGWVHPEKFDYVVVPTHSGREPIKPAADLVVFCWWSGDQPRVLWILGTVHGADEFNRRAVFYRAGESMPRGRASEGGAYVIEVNRLRPFPRELLKEMRDGV